MDRPLTKPRLLSFGGGDADSSAVDAAYLGLSLQGTAKVYNSIANFWYHGEIAKRQSHIVRIYVGPPQRGSLIYLVWFALNNPTLVAYPEFLVKLADFSIPKLAKAIFARKAGQDKTVEKMADALVEMAKHNTDLAKSHLQADMRTKERLFDLVDKLTSTNNVALREVAAPVGPSVKAVTHFKGSADEHVVDEAVAEAFRAREDVVVGDQTTFTGRFVAVDKLAQTCRIEIDGAEKAIRGKITDPALAQPHNIYTRALDESVIVDVTAKPIVKDGKITTLYVSDAKERGRRR